MKKKFLLLPLVLISFPVSGPLILYIIIRNKRRKKSRFAIVSLSRLLWAKQNEYASQTLKSIANNLKCSERQRHDACCALMTRYAFEQDIDQARAYGSLIEKVAPEFKHSEHRLMRMCQIEYLSGNLNEARRLIELLPPERIGSNAKLALASSISDSHEKLQVINEIYLQHGVTPIKQIHPDNPLTISNIEGTAKPNSCPSLGKVSIIIPVYNAENSISRAIRSICNQTYSDIEIVAVDDCSTDNSLSVLQKLAADDPRIVVSQTKNNSGAYPTRNLGLSLATGDFITVHDADDWSHPEKIEFQVTALAKQPKLVASASFWARTFEDFVFTNWQITHELLVRNFSSLMITRQVAETLGPWDPVRIGADSEYRSRIIDKFGSDSIMQILPTVPLSFGLDSESSLTRNKITHVSTIRHGMRQVYAEIAAYWRRQSAISMRDENLKKLEMLPRQFFGNATEPDQVDILYIVDCRRADDIQKIGLKIDGTAQKIALYHQPDTNVSISFNESFCDDYFELLMNKNVVAAVSKELIIAQQTTEMVPSDK